MRAVWFLSAIMPAMVLAAANALAQQPPRDLALDAATSEIGKALFLRCFCAENNLAFDAQGRPEKPPKLTDWTLSAVDIKKVERRSPALIELEGLRVAIRYAPDRHEFERHPQKDDIVKIALTDSGDPKLFAHVLDAIFSIGIDLRLQRAMPEFWQHYFDPRRAWLSSSGQPDSLGAKPIYDQGPNKDGIPVMGAAVVHKAEAGYTAVATRDRVQGLVSLRAVIDADGRAQRIAIVQPLGYGLDARAVEALEKTQFSPAMRNGQPVASQTLIHEQFEVVPIPR